MRSERSMKPSSAAGVAMILLAVAACSSGPQEPAPEDAARAVVEEFFRAGKAGEVDRLISLLSEADRTTATTDPTWTPFVVESEGLEYIVGGARVEGDRASVRVKLGEGGLYEDLDLLLVREEGEFRILEQETLDRFAAALADDFARDTLGGMDDAVEAIRQATDAGSE